MRIASAAEPLEERGDSARASKPAVTVALELRGGRSFAGSPTSLSEIDGVFAVDPGDADVIAD